MNASSSAAANGGLTILNILHGMDLGGVETLMIKLAPELRARGHRMLVASRGGRLVPELVSAGAEHYQITPTRRAVPQLAEIAVAEGVDLINGHQLRASKVSYLVTRKLGLPYVMCIHGPKHPLLRFFVHYWSPIVVAFSPSDRAMLVRGFRLPPERVRETFYGVDVERFAPSGADPIAEADPDCRRIVHASRLSGRKGVVTAELVAALPAIAAAVGPVQLLIAGDGSERPALEAQAREAARACPEVQTCFLGHRTDMPAVLRAGDVVVGAASVAIEAMACGRPLLAAGRTGYFGLVDEENFAQAYQTCFADHGTLDRKADRELFAHDLSALLNDETRMAAMGTFGRRKVVESFSVRATTQELLGIYREVMALPH